MAYFNEIVGLVVDEGKWEDCCHIKAPKVDAPVCGEPNAIRCTKESVGAAIRQECPNCGRPVCRACKSIIHSYLDAGEGSWEGEGEAP